MDIPTDFTGTGFHHGAMKRMTSSSFPGAGASALPGNNMGRLGPGMSLSQHLMDLQELMPFGGGMMSRFETFGRIPDLSRMFNHMGLAATTGQQFSSSSFVSISSGPDERPHVYQASSVTRQGPDGLGETRKTLQNSRTGTKKTAVGRNIDERGLVVESEHIVRTEQFNENHEFFNLEEDEVTHFHQQWRKRAHQGFGGRCAHSSSKPTIIQQVAVPTGPSYFVEFEEDQSGYQPPAMGYQTQTSHPTVTIEELSESDEEVERQQQFCANTSAPSTSLWSKQKRQKRSRTGKKY